MTTVKFEARQFAATQWETAEEKARFATWLVRFIEAGFPEAKFTKTMYRKLSNCFGHIAHFDRDGFYGAQFGSLRSRAAFLRQCVEWQWPSDVERAVAQWVRETGQVEKAEAAVGVAVEAAERAELARLTAKYAS